MAPRYFGSYPIVAKKGSVAYTLDLPVGTHIHPTFLISQLKRHIGSASSSTTIPPMDDHGALSKTPVRIVDRRMVRRGNHAGTEVLIEWANTFPEDLM